MSLIKYPLYFSLLALSACGEQSKSSQKEAKPVVFQKATLTNEFVSEGVTVFDVNNDGLPDVVAGTFWWEAPDWKKHELLPPETYDIKTYGNSFLNFSMDVNQDGWVDYIRVGWPGKATHWYENPKNDTGYWKEHLLYTSVGNESPGLYDIDGDGRLDLLCNDPDNKRNIWLSSPAKGETSWTVHVISDDTTQSVHMYTHGLGFGDINGDGRKDVVVREGWWEAPEDRRQSNWTFHKADISKESAQMHILDLNGDGKADIFNTSAHDYGIWWHEQKSGTEWVTHEIFPKLFSQSHGVYMADINGDGHPDFVTGKRYYAHNGGDPGAEEPSVLYWIEYQPGDQPTFIPHLVDDDSGAGLNLVVTDMNKDEKPDIIIGNKKGVFVFTQE